MGGDGSASRNVSVLLYLTPPFRTLSPHEALGRFVGYVYTACGVLRAHGCQQLLTSRFLRESHLQHAFSTHLVCSEPSK
jgi:hypothetical protein